MLLDVPTIRRAEALGAALRLAYTLCGGTPALLAGTRLARQDGRLVLRLAEGTGVFAGESVLRRLDALAAALGLDATVEVRRAREADRAALAPPRRYNPRMNDPELLDLAAGLARRAALAIEAVTRAGFAVERKTDDSPVTEADRIAEALIVGGAARRRRPTFPWSRRRRSRPASSPPPGARFWLVDPLDGTRDFAAAATNTPSTSAWWRPAAPCSAPSPCRRRGEVFGGLRRRRRLEGRRRTAAPRPDPRPRACRQRG